ncbi:uncharacterized protein LOC143020626 [Oratosquilla oratoria]|uniref:uncharacterized protein LOC143020626 n=1 Tax=Oratosquilla oratoria TaxID=337810 RepID=UPI003F7682DB
MDCSTWDMKSNHHKGRSHWNQRAEEPVSWNMENQEEPRPPGTTPPPPPPPTRHTPTPPLDYRSQSQRNRDAENLRSGEAANNSQLGATTGSCSSLLGPPPPPHFTNAFPIITSASLFPGSDGPSHAVQGHFPSQPPWAQVHQGYYSRVAGYDSFDQKWWSRQKQSMDAYLGGHAWQTGEEDPIDHHLQSSMPRWSFGTRVKKDDETQSSRHLAHSQSVGRVHRDGSREGNRGHERLHERSHSHGYLQNRDHHRRSLSAYRLDNRRRDFPPDLNNRITRDKNTKRNPALFEGPGNGGWNMEMHGSQCTQPLSFKKSIKGGKKKKKKSQLRVPTPSKKSLHSSSMKGTLRIGQLQGGVSRLQGSNTRLQGGSSSAMSLRAEGLNLKGKGKLTQTSKNLSSFAESAKRKALAMAANNLRKTFLATKKKTVKTCGSEEKEDPDGNESNENQEDKAQDLSMRKNNTQTVSLEYDIDIKFSAREWESVGRGQGGSTDVLGSTVGNRTRRSTEGKSGDDEKEDSGTYSDIEEAYSTWSSAVTRPQSTGPASVRRRHLSESSGVIDLRKRPSSASSTGRSLTGRMRSCSMSLVEGSGETSRPAEGVNRLAPIMPKLKRLILKQLLTMDKKSLQELVDDPRSRKAQFMMTHLMSEHRAALSRRLSQLRFKTSDQLQDELQLLHSLDGSQMNSLPPDVLQQVRDILALEERGDIAWDSASFSLVDILGDSDPDGDCQIISPPPRDPTSTITIQDSDSDMEDDEEEEDEDDGDDEEEEEEEEEEEGNEEEGDLHEEDQHEEMEEEEVEGKVEVRQEDMRRPEEIPNPMSRSSQQDQRPREEEVVRLPRPLEKEVVRPPRPLEEEVVRPPRPLEEEVVRPPRPLEEEVVRPPRPIEEEVVRPLRPHEDKVGRSPLAGPSQGFTDNRRASFEVEQAIPGPSAVMLPPSQVKVKEERPSPVSDCSMCLHAPHTSHATHCVCPYGMAPPSPVPLLPPVPPPPQPPPPSLVAPPPRPVPHRLDGPPGGNLAAMGSSLYQRGIKQEAVDGTYLKYEQVNRPSSEERPKNPAPPDVRQESLSHLHLPPPHQGIINPQQAPPPPPPPRPLIFSPERDDFPDPPRPPPPPPPQFSPRIKMERQTPVHFTCCCIRNECDRTSNHSAEARLDHNQQARTPDNRRVLGSPGNCKVEPSSPCVSRVAHMMPPISPKVPQARAINASVQTEREKTFNCDGNMANKRHFVPNLNLARGVTPLVMKVDQSTSTADLIVSNAEPQKQQQQHQSPQQQSSEQDQHKQSPGPGSSSKGRGGCRWWWHKNGRFKNHLTRIKAVSESLSNFEFSKDTGVALRQMLALSEQEMEFTKHIEKVEEEIHNLSKERRKMYDELSKLQKLRTEKMRAILQIKVSSSPDDSSSCMSRTSEESDTGERMEVGELNGVAENASQPYGSKDNASVVSSSQETTQRLRTFSFSQTSSNDSSNESQSVRRQRCTSTSHSPGRSERGPGGGEGGKNSKGSYQVKCVGAVNPNEEFYQQITNKFHQSVSNTDSETDNDLRHLEAQQSIETASHERLRAASVSSSVEGDVESEVAVEKDPEEGKWRRREPCHSNDNDEAVVGSSQQHSLKEEEEAIKEGSSNDQDREELCHHQTPESKPSLKHEEPEHFKDTSRDNSPFVVISSTSPSSPKQRGNSTSSSGNEHTYSLRSRGPPSEDKYSREGELGNLAKDDEEESIEGLDEQADDERENEVEKEEIEASIKGSSSSILDDKKRKRKRKTKKHRVNKRKKKKSPEKSSPVKNVENISRPKAARRLNLSIPANSTFSSNTQGSSSPGSSSYSTEESKDVEEESMEISSCAEDPFEFVAPPKHGDAVLELKLVGNFLFSASSDGTARCYCLKSGQVLASYKDHQDRVTCVVVKGTPAFDSLMPDFEVITGSADQTICVFNGKTGATTCHREVGEGVCCMEVAWGQLFLGTEGGCGARWNFKDKGMCEMVQYCGKAVMCLRATMEGSRKVLLVAAKTTPLMVRDAMSGLLLRMFEHTQLTVYTALFDSGILYTGGSSKTIMVHDFTTGSSKGQMSTEADVSSINVSSGLLVATCYDGLIRIFSIKTGQLLHRLPIGTDKNLFICSVLYKDNLLVGSKKGSVVCCRLPVTAGTP